VLLLRLDVWIPLCQGPRDSLYTLVRKRRTNTPTPRPSLSGAQRARLEIFKDAEEVQSLVKKQKDAHTKAMTAEPGCHVAMKRASIWYDNQVQYTYSHATSLWAPQELFKLI
jgi:hypothetical protein